MPVTGSDIRCLVQPRPYLKEQSLKLCQNASVSAVLKVGLSRLKLFQHDGFTIQVQQTSQIEKTHRLSPCKMESPQDQLQGELDYESVHPSYLKRP